MKDLKEIAQKRIAFLNKLRQKLTSQCKGEITQKLRITKCKGYVQYYLRSIAERDKYRYVSKKQIDLIKKTAQVEYVEDVIQAIDEELTCLEELLTKLPETNAERLYERLPPERQQLVRPWNASDEEIIDRWRKKDGIDKQKREVTPYLTERGEYVRSKSEIIIANALNKYGVPYRYEKPVILDGKMRFPDFTILNVRLRKEVLWEHFGMLDKLDYLTDSIQKVAAYNRAGYFAGDNLILTYECGGVPLDVAQIESIIQKMFFDNWEERDMDRLT
jgi:hypothetical protein